MPIESFKTLADYIKAQTKRDHLAGVPIPLVAEHLDVSPAAVTAMLNQPDGARNRLDGVRIGKTSKTTLVTLASLRARKTRYDDEVDSIYEYLREHAKGGTRAIFYDPVMTQVGLTWRVPADCGRIGGILAGVSKKSLEKHRVLLSVLVHQKRAGVTRPGDGFFELLSELRIEFDNRDRFVEEETDKVLAAYR
jgi:hypothetical protein